MARGIFIILGIFSFYALSRLAFAALPPPPSEVK